MWRSSFLGGSGPLAAVALDLVDALLERAGVALGVIAQAAQVFGEAFVDGRQSFGLPLGTRLGAVSYGR